MTQSKPLSSSMNTPTGLIASKFDSGLSPMDLIKQASAPKQNLQVTSQDSPSQVADNILSNEGAPLPNVVAHFQSPAPDTGTQVTPVKEAAPPLEDRSVELPPAPAETVSAGQELLDDIKKKPTKEESLSALRKKNEALSAEREAKVSEAEELRTKIAKYESGETIPEPVRKLQDRVHELEHWEEVHNLKFSRGYKENFIEPLTNLQTEAQNLAAEYDIPADVFNQGLALTKEKDLNEFLLDHFDVLGAGKAKDLIQNINGIKGRQREAEAKPGEVLKEFESNYAARQEVELGQKMQAIEKNAVKGWSSGLAKLRAQELFPELEITGDLTRDNAANNVMQNASAEFGKAVKIMVMGGATNLPVEFLENMAQYYLLGHTSVSAAKSNEFYYTQNQDLIKTSRAQTPFRRPGVGGVVAKPSVNASTPQRGVSAVDQLMPILTRNGK